MEKVIDFIINQIIHNFDFAYMFTVNILTYLIIKLVDRLNGNKYVSILAKRLILIGAIIIVGIVYYINDYNIIVLINSAIAAPVFWSWVLRPICNKFKIGYKQIDKTLN